ncbi:MAG: hypothetical protein HYV29_10885 [Ignavibacteriales bacterium]|nr:hypothetical protein [Ignavibacteriales bacterium]
MNTHTKVQNHVLERFPFDVIRMVGNDAVDFLQRITTNDFSNFKPGDIQKTLIITEKGRVIDAVWDIHRGGDVLMICSHAMANKVILWLKKFIIMEDIALENVTSKFRVDVSFDSGSLQENCYATDFFGNAAWFSVSDSVDGAVQFPDLSFEMWRIEQGIPVAKKELVQDYNPLELNLWEWISFTKGCYIGQEVIARLDTYNKIQRSLCLISSKDNVSEGNMIVDDEKKEIGKITSFACGTGLAVIRSKFAVPDSVVTTSEGSKITITKIFGKEMHGRN